MINSVKKFVPYLILAAVCLCCAFVLDFTNAVILDLTLGVVLCACLFVLLVGFVVWQKVKKGADLGRLVLYFAGGCVCIGLTFLMTQINRGALMLIITGFLWLLFAAVILYCEGRLNAKTIAVLIFAAGFILRLGYIAYTAYNQRQHDVYNFNLDGSGSGHARYILWFFQESSLPDFDPRRIWQFYQPPLHHAIAGLWMRFLDLFELPFIRIAENVQILTLFYSSVGMIISYKILKELGVNGSARLLSFMLIAFNPSFIIFAGSINNDILSITFMMGAILWTIRWYKARKFSNIIPLALCIGLGMMSKLSAALVAPAVALVFLVCLIKNFKNEWKKLFSQFAVFGVICIPLGMWWSVRNYVRFKLPIGYVPLIGSDVDQYIGFRSVSERLFDFSLNDVFMAWGENRGGFFEHNPLLGLLKTSVFGEFRFNEAKNGADAITAFSTVLFWVNVAICVIAFVVMIAMLIKSSLKSEFKLFSFVLYAAVMFSYIQFCFNYPHTCTMNIRYAMPLVIVGVIFLGLFMQNKKTALEKTVFRVLSVLIPAFCITTTAVYTLLAL